VVPHKRKMVVVGGSVAAALTLFGCAPAGAADYGNAAEPAANTVVGTSGPTADPAATSDPNADVDPDATAPPGSDGAAELSTDQTTDKLTGTSVKKMGQVIENEDGYVLYRFDDDKNKPAKSNCLDDCAKVWPPALTNSGKPTLKGVDAKLVGTVTRPDGTKQLTVNNWPLYSYIGDTKPGAWKGQNVGGKWFVIKPDGAKNLTCLPAISKPVAPPKDDSADAGTDYSY
jgi:predicted lipoprotein with Yx(FWY)xxD motif